MHALAGSTTLLRGKVTAEISEANFTLINPAAYVFSLWGIIYILLITGKNGDSLKMLNQGNR
jgi:hypothetical protein